MDTDGPGLHAGLSLRGGRPRAALSRFCLRTADLSADDVPRRHGRDGECDGGGGGRQPKGEWTSSGETGDR